MTGESDLSIAVLLVEDDHSEALVYEVLLPRYESATFVVTRVETVGDASRHLASQAVDVVLLDLFLSDSEGLATVRTIRKCAPEVPVVVLTSQAAEQLALRAVQEGAQDYLVKGKHIDSYALGRSVLYALERHRVQSGIAHLALYDALTGLPNRTVFLDRLQHALARAARRRSRVVVLFVDLDGLGMINDSLGQEVGDALLVGAAERLGLDRRAEDTLARIGGDEFAVICEEIAHDAEEVAERMVAAFNGRFLVADQEVVLTVSVGVAVGSGEVTPAEVIRDADAAMHAAKEGGGDRYELFDQTARARARHLRNTEQALRLALETNDFEVHYQPIVEISTGGLTGFEALVRWNYPGRGLVPPSEFIPIAERTGMIHELGSWVLHEACRQAEEWRTMRGTNAPLGVSVNLSARQLVDPGLRSAIEETLANTGLPPERLCLEITESAVMEDVESTAVALRALAEVGVKVAVDDFGTGYSSLVYLKQFPISVLKIDMSFVQGLKRNSDDDAIVRAVINLAHAMGQTAIAEGVETATQLAVLQDLGCDLAQGNYLGRPSPAATLAELVAGVGV